jgi:hypothetical protein
VSTDSGFGFGSGEYRIVKAGTSNNAGRWKLTPIRDLFSQKEPQTNEPSEPSEPFSTMPTREKSTDNYSHIAGECEKVTKVTKVNDKADCVRHWGGCDKCPDETCQERETVAV